MRRKMTRSTFLLGVSGAAALGILILLTFTVGQRAHAAPAPKYNVVQGTKCNDWTLGVHPKSGNPDNTLCNRRDLQGTDRADRMVGGRGWDYMKAAGGSDLLLGGVGMDQAYGREGNGEVYLQRGHDHVWGNQGNDTLNVRDGRDEADHIEEIHRQEGYDTCTVDNDPGDMVIDCEKVVVMRQDGFSYVLYPNSLTYEKPAAVVVKIAMPDNRTGAGR